MIRPVSSKAFEVAHDEPLVACPQRRCRKPQTRERRWPDVRDEDIGCLQQAIERPARLVFLEVESQRALVTVEMSELPG
jgi:hypothetical protein